MSCSGSSSSTTFTTRPGPLRCARSRRRRRSGPLVRRRQPRGVPPQCPRLARRDDRAAWKPAFRGSFTGRAFVRENPAGALRAARRAALLALSTAARLFGPSRLLGRGCHGAIALLTALGQPSSTSSPILSHLSTRPEFGPCTPAALHAILVRAPIKERRRAARAGARPRRSPSRGARRVRAGGGGWWRSARMGRIELRRVDQRRSNRGSTITPCPNLQPTRNAGWGTALMRLYVLVEGDGSGGCSPRACFLCAPRSARDLHLAGIIVETSRDLPRQEENEAVAIGRSRRKDLFQA